MRLSDFDYTLPKELIAQYPEKERDSCRLMVLDRKRRSISHRIFSDIIEYLHAGDLLALNNTKVIPARLFGKRKTGGKVELFLLDPSTSLRVNPERSRGIEKKDPVCEALVRPSARLKEGERITLESGDEVEILGRGEVGRLVRLSRAVGDILNEAGHTPLPPYIGRADASSDKDDYQTIYASSAGATASPTAGLHFTQELLGRIQGQGAGVKYVTLHTSYGTFAPVKEEDVENHKMHREYFEFPEDTAKAVVETKEKSGKVFAVGTTTTRVLEHCFCQLSTVNCQLSTRSGYTNLFIYPGYKFKVVDHLITNFHLPKSTLLLLVSAFAGKDFIFEAYREAVAKKYRFFSYGDAMLIL